MKIAIITVWYNEEVLAPFFLKFYSYVDDIFIQLDTATTDNTRSICEAHSNVTIRDMTFPNGFDDIIKQGKVNSVVRELECDWAYVIDADEFIQRPKQYKSAEEFLLKQERAGYNLVIAKMFQVYRHVTDKNLDINKPVLAQRCHGDPNLNTPYNHCYVKPIVIKPETDISWAPGCHICVANNKLKVAKERFIGAHWKNADDSFVIKRRIHDRKERFGKRQIAMRMAYQDIDITKESLSQELKQHRNDPDVLSHLLGET